jgi:hypothetical protein
MLLTVSFPKWSFKMSEEDGELEDENDWDDDDDDSESSDDDDGDE